MLIFLRILLTIIGSVDSEEVSLPHVQLFRCSAFAGRSVVIHGLHVEVLCIEQYTVNNRQLSRAKTFAVLPPSVKVFPRILCVKRESIYAI